jgi:hypothetical protein
MSAVINIRGLTATYTDGVWTCTDKSTERLLNATIPDFSGSDPNTEQTAAEFAVKNYGGEIVSVDEMKANEGVIY